MFSRRLRKQSLKALVFWPLSHAVYVLYAVGYQLVYSSGITFAVIGLGFFGLTRLRALMRISSGRRQSILLNPALIVGFCFFLVLQAFYVFKVEIGTRTARPFPRRLGRGARWAEVCGVLTYKRFIQVDSISACSTSCGTRTSEALDRLLGD